VERPLHLGDDPPVVEVGEDDLRSQPTARQIPQRGQKRVKPIPVLGRGHPVMPGGGSLPEHQAGVRGEAGLVVAEIEPPPLPACIVGHRAGDVVVHALTPQGERHAAGTHRAAGPLSVVGSVNSSTRKR
jgi:hypothetical protein